jgi:hypothetical protein
MQPMSGEDAHRGVVVPMIFTIVAWGMGVRLSFRLGLWDDKQDATEALWCRPTISLIAPSSRSVRVSVKNGQSLSSVPGSRTTRRTAQSSYRHENEFRRELAQPLRAGELV